MTTMLPSKRSSDAPARRESADVVWTLSRDRREAVCLITGEAPRFTLCLAISGVPVWRSTARSVDHVRLTEREWRAILETNGWIGRGQA